MAVRDVQFDIHAQDRTRAAFAGVSSRLRTMRGAFAGVTGEVQRNQRVLAGYTRGLVAPLAAIASASAVGSAMNAYTQIQNSLKVAGLEGDQMTVVFDRLYAAAQKNAAPIQSLVDLYSRATMAQQTLGASTEELLRFTEGVAAALRVSGKSASETSGALLQLSQALSNGVVQAEEYSSLLDGAYPVLQAVARGLKEAGGDVAALTRLVKSGQVSSEAFFRAFEAGQAKTEALAESTDISLGGAFQRLQNRMVAAVGKFDDNAEATGRMSDAIDDLGAAIEGIIEWLIKAEPYLSRFGSGLVEVVQNIRREFRQLGRGIGSQDFGEGLGFTDEISNAVQDVFDTVDRVEEWTSADRELEAALKRQAAAAAGVGAAAPKGDRQPIAAQRTVSVADFELPASSGDKVSKAEREAERARERVAETIAGLKLEREMLGLTNRERAIATELRRAEVDAASAQGQTIRELAGALYDEELAYQRTAEAMEGVRELGGQVLSSITEGIRNGASGGEILLDVLGQIEQRLISMASEGLLDMLFGQPGGGGSGFLSSIFGALTGGGAAPQNLLPAGGLRASGGPVFPGNVYGVGEQGRELFVPSMPGRIVPNGQIGGGGGVQIVDQRGRGQPIETERARGADGREFIRAIVRDELPKMAKSNKYKSFGLGVQPGRR